MIDNFDDEHSYAITDEGIRIIESVVSAWRGGLDLPDIADEMEYNFDALLILLGMYTLTQYGLPEPSQS